MSTPKEAAHAYLRRGWSPLPLHWVTPTGCSCGDPNPEGKHAVGKHPIEREWQKRPRLSGADIEELWSRYPLANVGLRTGPDSGFFVLDIDPKHGGDESLRLLLADHGAAADWPDTYIVRTGSSGLHYYFALPPDFEVTNRPGEFAGTGIDIRGAGGQVVAPPSISDVGGYRVVNDIPLVPAPDWVLDMIRPRPVEVREGPPITDDAVVRRYALSALEREVQTVMDTEVDRNHQLNRSTFVLATMAAHGALSVEEITGAMTTAGLAIGLDVSEVRKTVRSGVEGGLAKPRSPWPPVARERLEAFILPPDESPESSAVVPRSWDDLGNAHRIADHYGARLRWIETAGRWAVYSDGRWRLEESREAQSLVHAMIEALEATEGPLYDSPAAFGSFVAKQRSRSRIMAALDLAKGVPSLQASLADFDQDPMIINCSNGELDLRTGELAPHAPGSMLMQRVSTAYNPSASAPMFSAYLQRVHPNLEIRSFLQRVCGYSITGMMSEQKMFVHHGPQANGKSVFLNVMGEILGDYGQVVPRTTLLTKTGEGHPADVARMMGKRFLQTSETAAGRRLDEEVIKSITGGDRQTARFMYGDFFDFRPVGKIHYVTNHLPRLTDAESIWRRLVVIGWNVVIPEDERDGTLADRIVAEEAEGVFAWMVAGAAEWLREGLGVPVECEVARDQWRSDEDTLGDFIDTNLIPAPDHFEPTTRLYDSYRQWTMKTGVRYPMDQRAFALAFRERGIPSDRRRSMETGAATQHRGFVGLRVRDGATVMNWED